MSLHLCCCCTASLHLPLFLPPHSSSSLFATLPAHHHHYLSAIHFGLLDRNRTDIHLSPCIFGDREKEEEKEEGEKEEKEGLVFLIFPSPMEEQDREKMNLVDNVSMT